LGLVEHPFPHAQTIIQGEVGMKLIFPNGEHPQVMLSQGVNRIGSATDNSVVLNHPGVAPLHCELHQNANGVNLQLPAGSGAVTVNDKPVQGMIALRSGDTIALAGIVMRVAAMDAPRAAIPGAPRPALPMEAGEDDGATRMRMAVPKFILRGVSGPVFGKLYPVTGPTVIGRAPECTIPVTVDEISRRHVQLKPTADGLAVEDLGSANGTYVNGQRMQTGFMKPGDELRLDAVRFMLVAPGQEMASSRKAETDAASAAHAGKGKGIWVLAIVVVAACAAVYLLLH
jgi:pSer/pThr/pTyr-binding forkhead associated (FHA) protein